MIVLFVPPVVAGADEVAAAVVRALAARADGQAGARRVVSADGAPHARTPPDRARSTIPESAARALGHAAERAEWLRRPRGHVPELDGDRPRRARALVETRSRADDAGSTPPQARALLDAYGIPLVAGARRRDRRRGASPRPRELGFPVVVKTAAAGAHKTESGGVALDLATRTRSASAVERIGLPVLVQPMVRGGVELLAGVVQDPVFGPLVAFGPGGVFAELIGEAQFRIAPLTRRRRRGAGHGGKAGRLVAGFRGAPAADATALVDLVLRPARLAEDFPEVAELDLNPVLAAGRRARSRRAVDRTHPAS